VEINKKILIIDDQVEILETLEKILGNQKNGKKMENQLDDLLEGFFEKKEKEEEKENYQVITVDRGKKGYELVKKSLEEGEPFALAMIDMRMPGWDGLKTAKEIRELDKNIELVMVTAYSDISRKEILDAVKIPEKLLYLKKPFAREEILQIALSLTMKWSLNSELKKKNEELNLRNEKLEMANSLNKKLTVVSSHELRTPITLISGYIQLLESGAYEEKNKREKMYSNLSTATNRLIKIINRLLENFATSDKAESMIIKRNYFKIEDVFEETKAEVENFLEIRNQKLKIEVEKNLKEVYIDKHMIINFILINLLMNAIKYSKDNSTIKLIAQKSENSKCKVIIQDEGIGVLEDNLNYIFAPFFVEEDNSHHHSGVYEFKSSGIGLGLTIVENTLNLMGEKINCISKKGEGTKFEFTIPLKK